MRQDNGELLDKECRAGEAEGNGVEEVEPEPRWTKVEVSDAEFLRRLREDAKTRRVEITTVAPPVLCEKKTETREGANDAAIWKFVWPTVVALTLGSACVVGSFWMEKEEKADERVLTSEKQDVASRGFFAEGALTYRTASGATAPDEGAFVFLLPSEKRFGAPIALGDVSPQRPTPPGFESVVADLEARGARFAVADLEPGEYRVLLVSRCVGDDWGKANPAALKEIGRYVVSPRLLLGQSRFFWTTRRFDRDAATLEKSFGKAGAPFSNVE